MLIKDKIQNVSLSPIETSIIEYLEENLEDIQNISTRNIANKTYCSTSAVIRLANKLGYKGYNDLREEWIKERDYLASSHTDTDFNIPFSKNDSIMQVVNSVGSLHNAAMQDTIALLDQEELKKIGNCLTNSEHILVLGFSAYVPLATIFQQKMSRIRKHVMVQHHVGEENYQLDLLTKKDCAIMISYSGENTTLNNAASLLKKKGVPIIVITSLGDNTLSTFATHIVHISTREKLYSKIGNFASEESVLFILNIFYSLCFKSHYDTNLEYKINHAKEVEFNHYSSNKIINEE